MTVQVHWHEGLFLQPHHLQALQRLVTDRATADRRLGRGYPYGLVESKLSTDELENMRVRFDRLRVVMPSGIDVDAPGNCDLPSLDITERFSSSTAPFTVSLGVPLWHQKRSNALEIGETDWRIKRLYRIEEVDAPDENTGDNPQSLLVRKVNARLLLEGDDTTDMEVVPLLRVGHAAGEDIGVPRLERTFVPPCLLLSGSAVLREMLRDLANQVEAARGETVVQMTRGGFNLETIRGVQVQQMIRLQTLNRYAARLIHMVRAPGGVGPFEMYLELRGLLGELAALQPDRDAWDAPDYDHDKPGHVFEVICDRIRAQLRTEGTASWARVRFELREGMLVADLTDEQLTEPNEYFLGIQSGRDPRELAKLVEDQGEFKLTAFSKATTRVRGVHLAEERHPPLELPAHIGLHYFRIDRSQSTRVWALIEEEKKLAISYPGVEKNEFDDVSLYMTIPG
ncbi:MAG: type VI secretion system baseplate subunit TssK [Phycisphaeraceae bacterium]|nr:MAG: type VI secretion system baseplate subunit TssK [Phycisphaeraceae bacterium]